MGAYNSHSHEKGGLRSLLRYFSRSVITREHIENLKNSLKKNKKNKIINYNDNFIEHTVMEKGIRLLDKEDEIFLLIKEYLEPWLDDWYVMQKQIELGRWQAYDFYKLPRKLQSYMLSVDTMLHANWWRNVGYSTSIEEYDRREQQLKSLIPEYTQDDYDRYVLLGHRIPDTDGKKARAAARRAYKVLNEIIKCNIDKFEQFVTFTVAPEKNKKKHLDLNASRAPGEKDIKLTYIDGTDFEAVKKKYIRVMTTLGQKLKRKGIPFEYITVWEIQTNGNYHFHILCSRIPKEELYDVPEWLDIKHDDVNKERAFGQGLSIWKYGKSDVQEIKDKSRLTTYVSKYIMKSFQNVRVDQYQEYLQKKKYFPSKGLVRPEIEYFGDDEELDLDVDDLEPFVKKYTNPYNDGLITKKLYSKIV